MQTIVPYDQIGVSPPGPWQNAAPSSGVQGSIPNADFFTAVQAEIINTQNEAGLTASPTDFTQLIQAIRSGKLTAFADTGPADALVVTPTTAYTALAFGMPIQVLKGASGNATTTPTLSVSGIVRQIVKEDGTALAIGDLPASSLFSVINDGNKFRVVGLRKSDAAAAAGSVNVVNTATATAIYNLSLGGLTRLAVSAGLQQQSDIQVVPNYTNVITTGYFHGASFAFCNGAMAIRNTSGGTAGGTVRFACFDVTDSTVQTSPYVGGQPSNGDQAPFTVPSYVFSGLDPTKTYAISIYAQKGTADGTESTWDPSIFVLHNGVNN